MESNTSAMCVRQISRLRQVYLKHMQYASSHMLIVANQQVRIRCASLICKEYDLCVPCFSDGKSTRDHDPCNHPFSVIEQHSIPIYTEDWGADEESLLLEGAETYGLGSWADIADHIGGFREKDEVRDHYINTYINSSKFPLPEHASPADRTMTDAVPRDIFQARKKKRIEDRREAIKNAPPAPPKQKPTSSVPSCHEVQGFMPGRLEFETEHLNEAEEAVQHMQFEPGDGINPQTGELEPEMDLKMTVMGIYNSRLTGRVERKKVIFEHQLLEYRKNMAADKKRTKEERDQYNRTKPFARLMQKRDYDEFTRDIEYELNLRQAVAQLQNWRQMSIGDLESGAKYETEKIARAQRAVPVGSFDRFSTSGRVGKPTPPAETPSAVTNLTASDLSLKPVNGLHTPPHSVSPQVEASKVLTNGTGNANASGTTTPSAARSKFSMVPISNIVPYKFNSENAPDLHLLTPDEREVCAALRIMPKPYIAMKESVLKEASKHSGLLKKKTAREICRIDSTKGGKLFDFWLHSGWIGKA